MIDKRVIKTKKNIKRTLVEMLKDNSFEKITVADLCRRGEISRITFYTHYDDKYMLISEMYTDFITEADHIYHQLQKRNNTKNDAIIGYKNLLTAVLDMFYNNIEYFKHASSEENPYLFTTFFNHVYDSVDNYLIRHSGLTSSFPPRQTAALICHGLFGVINSCTYEGMNEKQVREIAESMYEVLLESNLFKKTIN